MFSNSQALGHSSDQQPEEALFGLAMAKVVVDLLETLPETEKSNKWMLVLTDHFSRWQDAIALPDATA